MENKKHSIGCAYLYYCSLTIYIALLFINQTELRSSLPQIGQQVLQLGRYLCYLLFLTKMVLEQVYQKKYLIACAVGFVFAALCVFSSGNKTMVFTLMALVAGYNCNWKKILKICTYVFGIGLVVTLLLCIFHIFHDTILDSDRMRHNLGFNWVTLAPIYMFFISIGYTNVRKNKNRLVLIGLWIVSYILYKLTDTRLTFLLNSLYLFGVMLQSKNERKQWRVIRPFRKVLWLLPFVIFVVILIVQKLYTPDVAIWDKLNGLLSGRLLLAHNSLNELPITPFGQAIYWRGFSLSEGTFETTAQFVYNNVDCSYIRLMFDYGAIGIFVFMSLYAWGIQKAVNSQNYLLVWGYIIVLLFSITEQWMMELSFNMIPLVAAASIRNGCRTESERDIILRALGVFFPT